MSTGKGNIPITLIYQGHNYAIRTYNNEYYSLMTLISAHLPVSGFGLCNGMGSCGTCLVKMRDQYSALGMHVLACDIKVSDALSNIQITIAEAHY